MIKWGVFREQIRNAVLSDADGANWNDYVLSTCVKWALDTFTSHTAYPKAIVIDENYLDPNGLPYDMKTAMQFVLPDDIFEALNISGFLYLQSKVDGATQTLDPRDNTPKVRLDSRKANLYWQPHPELLQLNAPIAENTMLIVKYFAYYPRIEPDDPEFVIPIPVWAEKPIATLTGAYALESLAVQSATIDRWKDKTDSGNPEQNSLRAQQRHMRTEYEQLLLKYAPQNRSVFFRDTTWLS